MDAKYTNNAQSTVPAGLVDGNVTSITVATGEGALFPSLGSGQHFMATLIDKANGIEVDWEIVKVTSRTGDVLGVERGQEGTTPRAWPVDTLIELRLTAAQVQAITDAMVTADNDVTANSFTGDLTGNVTGNLTGDVTGNVDGNVTGSAATAGSAASAADANALGGNAPERHVTSPTDNLEIVISATPPSGAPANRITIVTS